MRRQPNDAMACQWRAGSQDFSVEELANSAAAAVAAGDGQTEVVPPPDTFVPSTAAHSTDLQLYYGVVVLAQAPPCSGPL